MNGSNGNGNSFPTSAPPAAAAAAAAAAGSSSIDMSSDPASLLSSTTPNSKPREQTKTLQTYVYQDFANAEPSTLMTGTCHERVPPQSLQSQKLPSKLGAMLCDPDLTSIITWMPHGRSWKILNRELFSSFALPRYFGHSNQASFVRIVNAWGFRRTTKGPDRDSYYHELFLRGKPLLHERMKRLPTCHRKTPVDKDDKCLDFYELAKTSPLPEIPLSLPGTRGPAAARANPMPINAVSAGGYLGNPMSAAATHQLGALGATNHSALLGNLHAGSAPSMQGNDNMSALLKMIRQQQLSLQQQNGGNNVAANNQSLMHQLLLQNMGGAGMQGIGGAATNQAGGLGVSASFGQAPASMSSNNNGAILNSLANMNQGMNVLPQRRLSNDKISVNDVIQLRSIERTNELLAQKLATMQQDTMTMKQNSDDAPNGQQMGIKQESSMLGAPMGSPNTGSGGSAQSKEQMLLQMIRRENQKGGSAHMVSNQTEGGGNMNQGFNHLLKSLNNGGNQQESFLDL